MVDADGSVPSVNFRFAQYANGKRHERCRADTRIRGSVPSVNSRLCRVCSAKYASGNESGGADIQTFSGSVLLQIVTRLRDIEKEWPAFQERIHDALGAMPFFVAKDKSWAAHMLL